MSITQTQRRLVYSRASGCCEYCKLPSINGTIPFHIDHFIPRKRGGSDDNLCFACFNCNMYKSHDLTGFDPLGDCPCEKSYSEIVTN